MLQLAMKLYTTSTELSTSLHWYLQNINVEEWNVSTNSRTSLSLSLSRSPLPQASHLFWGIWALLQAANSTIDFDFIEYVYQNET